MKNFSALFSVTLLALASMASASAASVITVDENGSGNINGTPLASHMGPDPGPTPFPSQNTLIYSLPFTGVAGDVQLFEPETGIPGDVLRFNGNGTLIFYSRGGPGNTALADVAHPPAPVHNTVQLNETINGDALYTPTAGQPGFDASASPTYHFLEVAASTVPEPSAFALLLLGGAGLIIGKSRKFGRR